MVVPSRIGPLDHIKEVKYTGRHKYFDKTKDKYTHNLNLLLVNFDINGKLI